MNKNLIDYYFTYKDLQDIVGKLYGILDMSEGATLQVELPEIQYTTVQESFRNQHTGTILIGPPITTTVGTLVLPNNITLKIKQGTKFSIEPI